MVVYQIKLEKFFKKLRNFLQQNMSDLFVDNNVVPSFDYNNMIVCNVVFIP